MAERNIIPLNDFEKTIVREAFRTLTRVQQRAANNAKSANIHKAFENELQATQACEVKLFAFIA